MLDKTVQCICALLDDDGRITDYKHATRDSSMHAGKQQQFVHYSSSRCKKFVCTNFSKIIPNFICILPNTFLKMFKVFPNYVNESPKVSRNYYEDCKQIIFKYYNWSLSIMQENNNLMCIGVAEWIKHIQLTFQSNLVEKKKMKTC